MKDNIKPAGKGWSNDASPEEIEQALERLGKTPETKMYDEKPLPTRAQRRAAQRKVATAMRKAGRRDRELQGRIARLSPEELAELDAFLAENGVRRG